MKNKLNFNELIFKDFLNLLDNESILLLIKEKGFIIKYLKKQDELFQLASVKNNGEYIKYIKNPSEKVQLESINHIKSEFWFIELCLKKITNPIVLAQLYKKTNSSLLKIKIKNSNHWKDDASIVLNFM